MHKDKSLIEIGLGALEEGANEFNYTCKAADFGGQQLAHAGFTGKIEINVVAKKSADGLTLTINTSAMGDFTCDICLAPISKQLTGTLVLSYLFGEISGGENVEGEEYIRLDRSADSIDITGEVCETLLLSLPMKVTCTDNPDCRLYSSKKSTENDERPLPDNVTSWLESLEKLKNKYC